MLERIKDQRDPQGRNNQLAVERPSYAKRHLKGRSLCRPTIPLRNKNKPKPKHQPVRKSILTIRGTVACYANFCRVTGTPEELIIDFGLNNQPMGTPTEAIPISQRIIVNFFTAKRLFGCFEHVGSTPRSCLWCAGNRRQQAGTTVGTRPLHPTPPAPPQKA